VPVFAGALLAGALLAGALVVCGGGVCGGGVCAGGVCAAAGAATAAANAAHSRAAPIASRTRGGTKIHSMVANIHGLPAGFNEAFLEARCPSSPASRRVAGEPSGGRRHDKSPIIFGMPAAPPYPFVLNEPHR
jgi:hypothetical protein